MRVGIEVTAAITQGGGIGRYVRELLKAVSQLDKATQYRLFYAARQVRHPLPALGPNFHCRVLPFHDIWLARGWQRLQLPLPVQAITGRIDVYHSPDFSLPPVARNTPTVLTVHDLSFVRDPDSAAPGLRAYLNTVVPRSVRRATHVLADSHATRDDLIALYNTPPAKVGVLYPGVDARFQPVADAAQLAAVRQKYGLSKRPFIFSISTIQPRKNFLRLIQAFDRALRNEDIDLVIAGSKGWLYDDIFAEVEKRDLSGRVCFPGFVDDDDLPALYSTAHVLAYPSIYEGFGLPMLEAMACGTPVLASTASCLPEVAGEAALLVDPYDVDAIGSALQRLTIDDSLRADLIAKGQQRAAHFRWDTAARQLIALYQSLVA